jgi:hypothetical protein
MFYAYKPHSHRLRNPPKRAAVTCRIYPHLIFPFSPLTPLAALPFNRHYAFQPALFFVPLNTSMVVDKVGQEVYSLEQLKTIAHRYTNKEVAHHLQHDQKASKIAHTSKAAYIMEDAMNELDMGIETGEYEGPGSGKLKLPNGELDPDDHIKSGAYYQVLVHRFYSEWKDMFSSIGIIGRIKPAYRRARFVLKSQTSSPSIPLPLHSPLLPFHSLSMRPLTQRAPPTRAPTLRLRLRLGLGACRSRLRPWGDLPIL